MENYLIVYSVDCEFVNTKTQKCEQICFDYITPEPIENCYDHIINILSNKTTAPIKDFFTSYFSCVISEVKKINL
jgi:hypothetical protein